MMRTSWNARAHVFSPMRATHVAMPPELKRAQDCIATGVGVCSIELGRRSNAPIRIHESSGFCKERRASSRVSSCSLVCLAVSLHEGERLLSTRNVRKNSPCLMNNARDLRTALIVGWVFVQPDAERSIAGLNAAGRWIARFGLRMQHVSHPEIRRFAGCLRRRSSQQASSGCARTFWFCSGRDTR